MLLKIAVSFDISCVRIDHKSFTCAYNTVLNCLVGILQSSVEAGSLRNRAGVLQE